MEAVALSVLFNIKLIEKAQSYVSFIFKLISVLKVWFFTSLCRYFTERWLNGSQFCICQRT